MNPETALSHNIRVAINRTPRARLFDNENGVCPLHGAYGLGTGSPDLCGFLRGGRVFLLEVKMPGEHLKPNQVRACRLVRSWGGFAAEVHSIDEAFAALDRAELGDCE